MALPRKVHGASTGNGFRANLGRFPGDTLPGLDWGRLGQAKVCATLVKRDESLLQRRKDVITLQ